MTTPWEESRQRLLDLLADRAVFGLGVKERVELRELLPHGWNDEFGMMDQTAATCCLGLGIDVAEPLPFALGERIRADARHVIGCERR